MRVNYEGDPSKRPKGSLSTSGVGSYAEMYSMFWGEAGSTCAVGHRNARRMSGFGREA